MMPAGRTKNSVKSKNNFHAIFCFSLFNFVFFKRFYLLYLTGGLSLVSFLYIKMHLNTRLILYMNLYGVSLSIILCFTKQSTSLPVVVPFIWWLLFLTGSSFSSPIYFYFDLFGFYTVMKRRFILETSAIPHPYETVLKLTVSMGSNLLFSYFDCSISIQQFPSSVIL